MASSNRGSGAVSARDWSDIVVPILSIYWTLPGHSTY